MSWSIMMEQKHPKHGVFGCTENHIKAQSIILQKWKPNTLYGILEDDNYFDTSKLDIFTNTIEWLWKHKNSNWTLWNGNPSDVDKFPQYVKEITNVNNTKLVECKGYCANSLIFNPNITNIKYINKVCSDIYNKCKDKKYEWVSSSDSPRVSPVPTSSCQQFSKIT